MAIVDEKPDFSHVGPRIDANNLSHQPGGMPLLFLLLLLLLLLLLCCSFSFSPAHSLCRWV